MCREGGPKLFCTGIFLYNPGYWYAVLVVHVLLVVLVVHVLLVPVNEHAQHHSSTPVLVLDTTLYMYVYVES